MTDDLVMLVVGDFTLETFKCDIIIKTRNRELKIILALHPAYMALQYPLLFPFGERGFQVGVLYNGMVNRNREEKKECTLQCRIINATSFIIDQTNRIHSYLSLLSSQAKVDARTCIDENRLCYILNNNKKLCTENFQGISDAINKGCTRGDVMEKVIVISASHIGGRCYMIQNYHDSIAICRVHGPPDFFFTFTCNPKWPEIMNRFYKPEQKPSDKSDVIVRVYHMKLKELIDDIKSGKMFDPCSGGMTSQHIT
jgi:hypothetical protein